LCSAFGGADSTEFAPRLFHAWVFTQYLQGKTLIAVFRSNQLSGRDGHQNVSVVLPRIPARSPP